jgi:dCTP deaminase
MILTGKEIHKQYNDGLINIQPFNPEHVSTNSYDLRLGHTFLSYTTDLIDPAKKVPHEIFNVGPEGIVMKPGQFLLGHSMESLGSDKYVPIIHAKSGTARLGLFVHVTADLIDIGSHGQVTFQLLATLPVKLYPGMRIGQVSFWQPKGEISLYQGKYQSSIGPRASEVYKDFELPEQKVKAA